MSSTEESSVQPSSSEPKPIPKQPGLTIDNSAQCASYVSQRSSSIDTFGSISPTGSGDDQFGETKDNDKKETSTSGSLSGDITPRNDELNVSVANEGVAVGKEDDTKTQQWLCNDESMPASMLHPNHRSTPVKNDQYVTTALEGEGDVTPVLATEEEASKDEGNKEEFLPGDLQTPITGYETMEARSRFTVYKIQVNKTVSESGDEPSSWFIFRRYSDFLHLNERLRHLFPGFRLSLPPERWFRDNFDNNFLEDRMLGLQAFMDNITGHKDICNSAPVRGFLCTDEPPGPHDSLEESRALCDTLEESMYNLRQELQDKDGEIALLKEEVALYKSQVDILSNQLKAISGVTPAKSGTVTPTSPTTLSAGSKRSSLAECDYHSPQSAVSVESKSDTQEAPDSQ